MQADRVEILVPRHQAQPIIETLIKAGNSVVSDYSILRIKIRRDGGSEEKRQRRSAYYAHRALEHTLRRGNLGRSVTLLN